IFAIVGWIIAHRFTAERDRKNKKREITLQHLISSYQILTHEISHRPTSKERNDKFEKAITDIQLFGTPYQVELVIKLSIDVPAGNAWELDSLINDLRSDLRKELDLKQVNGNVNWLRFRE
ncbi:MAG: hypothetical protein L6262_00415, partial [Weeksellaceae bacterium]|nr:hypothetical protein [Weeksellaceae bacterium]